MSQRLSVAPTGSLGPWRISGLNPCRRSRAHDEGPLLIVAGVGSGMFADWCIEERSRRG